MTGALIVLPEAEGATGMGGGAGDSAVLRRNIAITHPLPAHSSSSTRHSALARTHDARLRYRRASIDAGS